jgi:hypothetical protein
MLSIGLKYISLLADYNKNYCVFLTVLYTNARLIHDVNDQITMLSI